MTKASRKNKNPKAPQTRNYPNVGFTLTPEALYEIDRRVAPAGKRSTTLSKLLERQSLTLAKAGDKLRNLFTNNEWAVLLDAVPQISADTLLELQAWQLMEQEIIRRDLARKYKADPRGLMNKLASLDVLHIWALVDIVERWQVLADIQKPSAVNPYKCEELIV